MEIKVEEMIESYNKYIEQVISNMPAFVSKLRNSEVSTNDELNDFIDGLLWMLRVREVFECNNIPHNFDVTKLNDLLKEINEGLTNDDRVYISDILEYEIIPFFNDLNEVKYDIN